MIFHLCIYHNLFTHSVIDDHLGCFHLLAIVNSAAMNTCVHIFALIPVFNYFQYVPRSISAKPYGNPMLNFLRKDQTIFHSD